MKQKQQVSTNKMGIEPIKSLLISMGVPMIVSMALQALYNIVDSYFVSCMKDTAEISNMGDNASNSLVLAFPVQMLMVAIGVGTGVGINALLSKSLGEGDRKKASKIAGNSIFLGLCMFVVFLVFGIFGIDAYVRSQTSNPIIVSLTTDYLKICTIGSLGISMYITFEKLLQSTGKTMLSTISQITGALVNVVLDPILIFGYLGLPELGIKGAGYATIIGQFVTCIMDAIFHYKYNKSDIDTELKYIKPVGSIIKEIYLIGIPAIIMQALMSFMTYGVNIIFNLVSTSCVTAYGIYYKVQQFVFFMAFGMNNAIIPIVSFNFGMGNRRRVNDGIKYGVIYTLVIMLLGAIVLQILAKPLIGVFAVSDEVKSLCILAIRIITLGYLFVGVNIAYQGVFQALGSGVRSLILSMVRLIVVALPLAYVFTKFDNAINLVWWAFPIAEAVAVVVAIVFMKQIRKQTIDTI